jgi:iron(III) transport system permease protein
LVVSILLFTVWPVLTILGQACPRLRARRRRAMFLERFFSRRSGACLLYSKSSCGAAWNTLELAIATATACMLLGLAFALIVTRTGFRFKQMLRLLTVLPIITPPFVIGLGLILIFGRSGLINQWMTEPVRRRTRALDLRLQRRLAGAGIFLHADGVSGPDRCGPGHIADDGRSVAHPARQPGRYFASITLPLMLPGLANAWLVVFIESLADFGNPILLGGSMGVLSTEIFFASVGAQADFGRAGTLAIVLLIVRAVAFFAQRRILGKRSYVSMTGKGDGGLPTPLPLRVKYAAFAVAMPWAALTIFVYLLALAAAS